MRGAKEAIDDYSKRCYCLILPIESATQMAKRHGWLVGALDDHGFQQRDLARAWKVDDAVVSRFINSGKPDLTPQRQMLLAQMLGMTNDQLLSRLYGDASLPRIIASPARGSAPSSNPHRGGIEQAHAEVRRAIERLQELMPDATVTVTITYRGR
jgi:hypothetical protein